MPAVGEIWRHAQFYPDPDTGELLPKFLLVLAVRGDGDVVYRLLTSRAHGRRACLCGLRTRYAKATEKFHNGCEARFRGGAGSSFGTDIAIRA